MEIDLARGNKGTPELILYTATEVAEDLLGLYLSLWASEDARSRGQRGRGETETSTNHSQLLFQSRAIR